MSAHIIIAAVFLLSLPAVFMMVGAAARAASKLYAPSTLLFVVGMVTINAVDLADDVPGGSLITYMFAGMAFIGSCGIYHVMGKDTWGSIAEATGAGFGIISIVHTVGHYLDAALLNSLEWYQLGYIAMALSMDLLLLRIALELWRDDRRMAMALGLAMATHLSAVFAEFIHDSSASDRAWHVAAMTCVGLLTMSGAWYGYERIRAVHLGQGSVAVEPDPSQVALLLTSVGFVCAMVLSVLSHDHGVSTHSLYFGVSCFAALILRQIATLDLMRRVVAETNTERQHYQLIVTNTSDAIGLCSPLDGQVQYVSGVVRDVLGLEPDAAEGRTLAAILDADPAIVAENLQGALQSGYTSFVVPHDQRTFEVSLNMQRKLVRFAVSDVTGTAALEQRLEALANEDSLTGLPNRSATMRGAQQQIDGPAPVCAIFLDLTGFKAANDTYGHAAGDEALRVIAQRFTEQLPADALLGRLGGDEFLAITSTDTVEAMRLAWQLIEAVEEPIAVGATRLSLSCAAGICEHRGQGLVDLVREADMAMYAAKASRDTNVVVYETARMTPAGTATLVDTAVQQGHNMSVEPVRDHAGAVMYGHVTVAGSELHAASQIHWDYVIEMLGATSTTTRLAIPVLADHVRDGIWRSAWHDQLRDAGVDPERFMLSVVDNPTVSMDDHFLKGAKALEGLGVGLILPRLGAEAVVLADSPWMGAFASLHYFDVVTRVLETRPRVRPVVFELAHWASMQGITTVLTSVTTQRQRDLAAALGVTGLIDGHQDAWSTVEDFVRCGAPAEVMR